MPFIVDGFWRRPSPVSVDDSVALDDCPLVGEAAGALLGVLRGAATSVRIGPPPLQMGEQLWGLLSRGPGTAGERRYAMADRQIHALDKRRVQASREA